jgi:hypothetical protein
LAHLLDDINVATEQQQYMVFWQMPIWAASPREAAEKAQYLITCPDMISGVFDVVDEDFVEYRVDVSISEEEEIEQDLELMSIGC